MIDATVYKNVLGSFPSGVTVITTQDDDGSVVGLTASAFSSLSMDPPLVLFCPNYSSDSYPVLIKNKRFAIHVLSGGQQTEAYAFARKGKELEILQAVNTAQADEMPQFTQGQHAIGFAGPKQFTAVTMQPRMPGNSQFHHHRPLFRKLFCFSLSFFSDIHMSVYFYRYCWV